MNVAQSYPKASYHVKQLIKSFITSNQRQENFIRRVGPTQWHDNCNPYVLNFETFDPS
jgi:hypothetical protein